MTVRDGTDLGVPFDVEVVRDGDRVIATVSGELDIATVPQLEAALEEPPAGGELVLDLRPCTFMDSSAIRVVMTIDIRARAVGFSFVIARSPGAVSKLLDLCQVPSRVQTRESP